MGISLSGGPWQYNRFDLAEASKPDYLDFDKDGDKKEPMKKALKEKGKKPVSEKKELPDFIKKKVDEKKGKKKDDCECDKKEVKEWVSELIDEGHDLSEYTWDDMIEMFNEGMKHREADTGKVVDKAEIGKTYYPHGERQKSSVKKQKVDPFGGRFKKEEISLDENRRAARSAGGYKDDSKKQTDPSKDGFTGISGSIKEIMRQNKEIEAKNKVKKEEVCHYLMSEGFANNPVSAEIMFNHMSEEWLDAIEEAFKPFPKEKVSRQADRAYDKEQSAVRAGNEKEVNKQMQRRIAMKSPMSRRTALQNKNN